MFSSSERLEWAGDIAATLWLDTMNEAPPKRSECFDRIAAHVLRSAALTRGGADFLALADAVNATRTALCLDGDRHAR